MAAIPAKLRELINLGLQAHSVGDYDKWAAGVEAFLRSAVDEKTALAFHSARTPYADWEQRFEQQKGHLEGLVIKLEAAESSPQRSPQAPAADPRADVSAKKIFVVHGHDNEIKETVARFLANLGLEPVIFHEKAIAGRTVIEKFEMLADVGFAVVLLSPDDVGKEAGSQGELRGRARQNVILELGYFMGKLSRKNVCTIFRAGVEIPSDYLGVLHIQFDAGDGWKMKLAQELIEANYTIRIEALVGR